MSKAELLDRLLFLENEKTRVICESTDANAWKKYYDMQIKELEAYAEQVAKEAFDEGWVSAWKENGERNIAELSYQDREVKQVQEYYNEWKQQSDNTIRGSLLGNEDYDINQRALNIKKQ